MRTTASVERDLWDGYGLQHMDGTPEIHVMNLNYIRLSFP
jgi:hypothetical protein